VTPGKSAPAYAPSKQRYGWCVSPTEGGTVITIDRARELAAELLTAANDAEKLNATSAGSRVHEVDCFLPDFTVGDEYVLVQSVNTSTGASVLSVHEADDDHHQPGRTWGDRKRNPRYAYTAMGFVTAVTTHQTDVWQTVRFMEVQP
jgi:hypothetical protein